MWGRKSNGKEDLNLDGREAVAGNAHSPILLLTVFQKQGISQRGVEGDRGDPNTAGTPSLF